VPVNIDDAHPEGSTGLIEAHLALTYNPQQFSVSAADIHLGSLLSAGSGWTVVPTINPLTGEIAIALSSTTPISAAVGGSLVTIDLHQVAVGSRLTSPPVTLVASVNPTGAQVITTELEDAQGTFTLSPTLTNSLATSIPVVIAPAASSLAVGAPSSTIFSGNETTVEETPVDANVQVIAAEPAATEPSVTHVGTAVHAPTTSAASAPLAGLIFQVAGLSVVSLSSGLLPGQHLADQFFQILARANGSPAEALFAGSLNEALTAPSAWLRTISVSEEGDSFGQENWNGDVSGANPGDLLTVSHRRQEVTTPATVPATTDQPISVDRDTLDQVFAQSDEDE
jgi:hypothetical protein